MDQRDYEEDLADLDEVDFQDPLEGSILDVSAHEEVAERFTCGICDSSFATNYNLQRHCKTHNDRFTFECTKCTQYFTTKAALTAHQKAKHREKHHLCTSCGKTFTKKAHLQVHQRRFHDPEPLGLEQSLKCPFESCTKTFQQKEKFQVHLNMHKGLKPFSCGTCGKQFQGKYYRNSHEKICIGDIKTKCDICSLVLSDLSSFKRHKDAQHEKRVFTCHCGKSFAYQSSLVKHQKNKH